ncbi:MAG: flagellar basal body-associated FliL family protein [Spirochaetales bacterium]|nr:flagellar basal body-associated FliL family protein [Spirochaetales bacterium]
MGDEDIYAEEDVTGGQDLEVGKKRGFIPAFVLKSLKWVALGLAAIIFIVTVVYFTMKIINRGSAGQTVQPVSEAYADTPPQYSWYQIDEIRTRTSDRNPATVILIAKLGYEKDSKDMQTELIAQTELIYDRMRQHLAAKTMAELTPQNEDQLKEELRRKINGLLRRAKVEEIVFLEFNVFEF